MLDTGRGIFLASRRRKFTLLTLREYPETQIRDAAALGDFRKTLTTMKTTHQIIKIAGIILVLGGLSARADDIYIHANVGPAFAQDVKLTSSGVTQTFKTGVRGDISFGYDLNDRWAVEIETGVIWNQADTIGGHSVSPRTIDFYQYPILANAIYKIHWNDRWTSYFGAGGGGVATRVDATLPTFRATDWTAAYQAQAGIAYSLNSHVTLDFGYKFFGSLDHSFTDGSTTKTDPFYTHAILLSFSWKF